MSRHFLASLRFPRTTLVMLLAGSCVCTFTGCNRQDETAKAVKKASHEVNVIGGGGGPAATVLFENKQYAEVITLLTPVVEKGLEEEKAAALVIIAQAQMGQAAEPSGAAGALERECLDRMTIVRSLLGDWLTANARAAALEEFDPGPTLKELGTSMGQKEKLIAEQQGAKAKLDAQIADLKAQAAERAAGAQAEENSYAKLKEQASKVSAVQGEPLVKEAAEHKRKSDELRNAGALLEARAEQVSRQSAESQLLIDQYTNQKTNYQSTDKSLRDKLAAAKTEAGAARAEGVKTSAKIDALIGELRTQRSGALNDAAEKALKGYQSAVSSANKAAKGDQNGGSKLTLGAAQQAIGDLQWTRAQGLAAYAQLLDSLAKAEPALAKRAEYAKEAADAAAARKEALDSAKAAYEAAQAAYSAVRAKGEAKDRLDQLSKQLEGLSKVAGGDAKDLAAAMKASAPADAPAPEAAPKAETPAAAALPPGATPELVASVEAVLASMKSGRQVDTLALLYFPPELAAVKEPLTQMALAADKVNTACRAKFNVGLAEITKSLPGGGGLGMGGASGAGLSPEQLAALKVTDLQFTVEGDKAKVMAPGSATPLNFVKADGKWLMDTGLGGQPPQALAAISMMGPSMSKALEELAAEIDSGKLATPDAVGPALMQKLAAAMGAAKPPTGPGGG